MKKYVFTIVICVFGLLDLGLVMLGRSSPTVMSELFWPQAAWIGVGLLLMMVAAKMDYRIWRWNVGLLMTLVICLLFMVLIPHIGIKEGGSRRMFKISGVQVEPASLGKLAVIVYLAAHLARRGRLVHKFRFGPALKLQHRFRELYGGVIAPMLVVAVIVLLVEGEPNFSDGLLIVVVAMVVMLVGGIRGW